MFLLERLTYQLVPLFILISRVVLTILFLIKCYKHLFLKKYPMKIKYDWLLKKLENHYSLIYQTAGHVPGTRCTIENNYRIEIRGGIFF